MKISMDPYFNEAPIRTLTDIYQYGGTFMSISLDKSTAIRVGDDGSIWFIEFDLNRF